MGGTVMLTSEQIKEILENQEHYRAQQRGLSMPVDYDVPVLMHDLDGTVLQVFTPGAFSHSDAFEECFNVLNTRHEINFMSNGRSDLLSTNHSSHQNQTLSDFEDRLLAQRLHASELQRWRPQHQGNVRPILPSFSATTAGRGRSAAPSPLAQFEVQLKDEQSTVKIKRKSAE